MIDGGGAGSGLSATGDGGGIHQGPGTDLFVVLSTIRNNTAGSDGGGIFATGSSRIST